MKYTNEQLKRTLAKMLPEKVKIITEDMFNREDRYLGCEFIPAWKDTGKPVLDTELLHLCWLVEETLDGEKQVTYLNTLYKTPSVENNKKWKIHPDCHATWQQRTIALAQTLGIEIV